jgi:hypothetical protein
VSSIRVLPAGSSLPAPDGESILSADEALHNDGSRTSPDGENTLVYQGSDGNLVLYHESTATWASDTQGNSVGMAVMQGSDGNFVVYDASFTPVWDTGTQVHANAFLDVQNDGNVVVYDIMGVPLWEAFPINVLNGNQALHAGEALRTPDALHTLIYQGDGNLVLYGRDGSVEWSSNTAGTSTGQAVMQTDGNFVIYNAAGVSVFATHTDDTPGAYLVLGGPDFTIAIYRPNGIPRWVAP